MAEEEVSGVSVPVPDRDGEGFVAFLLGVIRGIKEGRDGSEAGGTGTSSVLRRLGDALRFGFGLAPEREIMFDFKTFALSGD